MDYYSSEQPAATKPTTKSPGNAVNADLRRTMSTFVCDGTNCGGAAAGAVLHLPLVPAGARGVRHRVTVSKTLGAATLEIGTVATPTKYSAAATYTAPEAPVSIAKAENLAAELAADEAQIITTGAAALPNDGTVIVVETEFTVV